MPNAVPIRQDISAAELRQHAKIESDGRASRRMLALAAVRDGASRADAAQLAGMDCQNLRDWVHRFNEEGIAGLYDRPHTGRPPRLSEGQMAAFKADRPTQADFKKNSAARLPRRKPRIPRPPIATLGASRSGCRTRRIVSHRVV